MGLFGCGDRGGFAALLKLLEMYQNQRKGKYIMRLQSFSFKCVIRSSEGFWLRSFAPGCFGSFRRTTLRQAEKQRFSLSLLGSLIDVALGKAIKGIVHNFFLWLNLIFCHMVGCGIAHFGRRGLVST